MTRDSGTPTSTSVCEASITPDSNASGTTSEAPAAVSRSMSASSRARTITGTDGIERVDVREHAHRGGGVGEGEHHRRGARDAGGDQRLARARCRRTPRYRRPRAASRTRSGSRSSAT